MSDSYYVRIRGRSLGPYGLDMMRQMIHRGQAGRSHEVSYDSQSWRPAETFVELFEKDGNSGAGSAVQPPRWHYTAKGIEQPGPIDHQSLLNLIAAGQVGPLDKVRNESMADWEVVCHLPELVDHVPSSVPVSLSRVRRSPSEWWLQGWRRYGVFEGRACREEFWYYALFNLLLGCLAVMLDLGFRTIDINSGVGLFQTINSAATIVPTAAVAARRLHDTNRSGWSQLVVFAPVVGAILLLIWLAADGDPHANQYGSDPKWQPGEGARA